MVAGKSLAPRLLLLSSSRYKKSGYLEHARCFLSDFLGGERDVLFVPFAGVRQSHDAYVEKVRDALSDLKLNIRSVHETAKPKAAVAQAGAILIGGGNTFALLSKLQDLDLLDPIRRRVANGCPYIGWSAGSNIAGETISTTNDMPICEPKSFSSLALLPFQINPHFTRASIRGHRGETRIERLTEYLLLNPDAKVIGLPEGTALTVEGEAYRPVGRSSLPVFSLQTDGELKTDFLRESGNSFLKN